MTYYFGELNKTRCVDEPHFLYPSAEGVHNLAIVTSAAINIEVQVSFCTLIYFFRRFPDHMGDLAFWGLPECLCLLIPPPAVGNASSSILTVSAILCPAWDKMEGQCGFNLDLLSKDADHFSGLIDYLDVFLRIIVQFTCPLIDWMICVHVFKRLVCISPTDT